LSLHKRLDRHWATAEGSHSTCNRQGAVHASRRNLHHWSPSLQLLSSVTARMSRLMVATQQVKRKGKCMYWWPHLASLEKPDYPISYFGTSGFVSFRIKHRKELTLKIQDLRHGKRLRSIKEPRWKKSKPKTETTKTRLSGLGYQSIRFFWNR
jgi:hypothetical protein